MNNYSINVFGEPVISGKIKSFPEDFVVEEVTPDGKVRTVDYGIFQRFTDMLPKKKDQHLHLTLVKRNYTTLRAIAQLSHRLRFSKSRIGYAGTKDKKAVTAQRISIWNVKLSDVKKIKMKDLLLKDFEFSEKRLTLGDLSGNRFTITIRGSYEPSKTRQALKDFSVKLNDGIPNYFGPQRFGLQRPVNQLVGKQLLLGNFEGALMILLTNPGNENEDARKAREFAAKNWGSWAEILKVWPANLGVEAALLNYLVRYPKDFANAFRRLPKNLRRMFVHAFQSYVFNIALSSCIERGIAVEELPVVGFETKLEGEVGEIVSKILKDEDIKLEMFQLKRMPELAERGEFRKTKLFPKDFEVLGVDKEKIKIRFFLEKGSYATVLLYMLVGDFGE